MFELHRPTVPVPHKQPDASDLCWCKIYDHALPMMRRSAYGYYTEALAKGDAEGIRLWNPNHDHGDTYRTMEYVLTETTRLAAQLGKNCEGGLKCRYSPLRFGRVPSRLPSSPGRPDFWP